MKRSRIAVIVLLSFLSVLIIGCEGDTVTNSYNLEVEDGSVVQIHTSDTIDTDGTSEYESSN